MNVPHRLPAVDGQELLILFHRFLSGIAKGLVIFGDIGNPVCRQVGPDGVRNDKIAVRQALHESTGAQSVGPVI